MPDAAIALADGAENNGFATMLCQMLRQNLDDHTHKRRDFDRLLGRVAIVVEDAGVSVTLHFDAGALTLHDGIVGIPDLTIRGSSEDVMKMSLVELLPRLGVPDLRRENARDVFRATHSGRVKMYGALPNLPLVVRLTRVMSIHP